MTAVADTRELLFEMNVVAASGVQQRLQQFAKQVGQAQAGISVGGSAGGAATAASAVRGSSGTGPAGVYRSGGSHPVGAHSLVSYHKREVKDAEKATKDAEKMAKANEKAYERSEKAGERYHHAMMIGSRRVVEGVSHLGRAMILLNVATDKDKKAALELWATFEAGISIYRGIIHVVEGMEIAMRGYRDATLAAAAAEKVLGASAATAGKTNAAGSLANAARGLGGAARGLGGAARGGAAAAGGLGAGAAGAAGEGAAGAAGAVGLGMAGTIAGGLTALAVGAYGGYKLGDYLTGGGERAANLKRSKNAQRQSMGDEAYQMHENRDRFSDKSARNFWGNDWSTWASTNLEDIGIQMQAGMDNMGGMLGRTRIGHWLGFKQTHVAQQHYSRRKREEKENQADIQTMTTEHNEQEAQRKVDQSTQLSELMRPARDDLTMRTAAARSTGLEGRRDSAQGADRDRLNQEIELRQQKAGIEGARKDYTGDLEKAKGDLSGASSMAQQEDATQKIVAAHQKLLELKKQEGDIDRKNLELQKGKVESVKGIYQSLGSMSRGQRNAVAIAMKRVQKGQRISAHQEQLLSSTGSTQIMDQLHQNQARELEKDPHFKQFHDGLLTQEQKQGTAYRPTAVIGQAKQLTSQIDQLQAGLNKELAEMTKVIVNAFLQQRAKMEDQFHHADKVRAVQAKGGTNGGIQS